MSAKKSNQEATYVGIYDAKGLRKSLLINAKELLILLKDVQLEKLKNKVYLEKVGMVKKDIQEIETLSKGIISSLPIKNLGAAKIKASTQKSTAKEQETDKNDELYRIDLEIKRIEQLLNKI